MKRYLSRVDFGDRLAGLGEGVWVFFSCLTWVSIRVILGRGLIGEMRYELILDSLKELFGVYEGIV